MTTLREAAQQALEALEDIGGEWGFTSQRTLPKRMDAITALRAALAEQGDWPICHHCGQMMCPEPLRREHE